MSLPTRFSTQGLMPAYRPDLAISRVFSVPYGGPADGSQTFLQGQALGCIANAAIVNEVATLTIGGTPTGGTFTVSFNGYTTAPLAFSVSTVNFLTALGVAVPEFAGNFTIIGTAGSSYVITAANALAGTRIGGLFAVNISGLTGGTPTGAWVRTTRGSCGLAQADVYSQGSNNRIDGFLKYDTTLSPGGAYVPNGAAQPFVAAGQPFTPSVYVKGIFTATDLVGVDANALTLKNIMTDGGGLYVELV